MIPDWDLPHFIKFHESTEVKQVYYNVINWIVTNINQAVQSKKDSLTHRQPGAVVSGKPEFIWIKMINRHAEFSRVLKNRTKFNTALEDIISQRKGHSLIDVNYAVNERNYFSPRNRLTGDRAAAFWREVDKSIEVHVKTKNQWIEDDHTEATNRHGQQSNNTGFHSRFNVHSERLS